MIKKLRNQPYAPKWEKEGRKKGHLDRKSTNTNEYTIKFVCQTLNVEWHND
jgi:hypothetical protein